VASDPARAAATIQPADRLVSAAPIWAPREVPRGRGATAEDSLSSSDPAGSEPAGWDRSLKEGTFMYVTGTAA
jgi:hypothetical protein